MSIRTHIALLSLLSALAFHSSYSFAVKDPKNGQDTPASAQEDEAPATLEVFVEDMTNIPGIFTLYRSGDKGDLHMAISEQQLNKEFLYFAVVQNGVLDSWSMRGAPIAQDVIEIRRYYDRIEFVKKNTHFYVDPNSPLANGGQANVSDAVLASADIAATSEDGATFLINANILFQTEALAQVTYNLDPERAPHEQFNIGSLAQNKVKYTHVGNYPKNMNVRTDYVYENSKPFVYGSESVADARAITISVQHSFIEMPNNDFVGRQDDQRVGIFSHNLTDLNSFDFMPYKDFIDRFHLVKKDPTAAISEPVEPILWWIENTTPLEYRDILKAGVLAWNSAFEKAGFKNAIVVKIQPDDANWNAEDIRYNVIRWSNTPDASFAFGPNFVNPRTGQILGGDVMFEHSFLVSYGFDGDVLANPDTFLSHFLENINDSQQKVKPSALLHCSKGEHMREMTNFGYIALNAMNASVSEKRKIIEQMLMELMLHEVGHVLGLSHNMKASNYRSFDDVFDAKKTQGITTSSIMDYTALVIAKPGQPQGDYFASKPGPYDDWAIQFAYDPNIEGAAREELLARSTEPMLMFGNDADDMRSPGNGIDPRINVWDMSSDSIAFAQYQFELVNEITPLIKEKLSKSGESWAKLRAATSTMITYKASPTAAIASYIGGVEVSRFVQNQASDSAPYQPISKETQQRAMQVLAKFVFAPDAFSLPPELIRYSLMQRRGFSHFGTNEDPKLHLAILGVQKVALSRLLNPSVTLRLSDTLLYGNNYSVDQMMSQLTDTVFKADLKTSVNTHRQLLQHEYVMQLIAMLAGDAHDPIAKAASLEQLDVIYKWTSKSSAKDNATRVHRNYLAYLIGEALDKD